MKTNHQHITNEHLVDQFQNGQADALKFLIKRFHPELVRRISYHTKNREAVDDLVRECWYVIIEKLERVQLKISFEVWALAIARHKAIDWIQEQQQSREHAQQVRIQAESKTPGNTDDTESRVEFVQKGIQQLPLAQQIVLTMFYLENLSVKEIAKVLDITEGTVKSRLFYVREKLKDIINP